MMNYEERGKVRWTRAKWERCCERGEGEGDAEGDKRRERAKWKRAEDEQQRG